MTSSWYKPGNNRAVLLERKVIKQLSGAIVSLRRLHLSRSAYCSSTGVSVFVFPCTRPFQEWKERDTACSLAMTAQTSELIMCFAHIHTAINVNVHSHHSDTKGKLTACPGSIMVKVQVFSVLQRKP